MRGLGEGSSRLFQPLRGSAFVSQAVTELRVAAEVLFFRPLTRAGDVLALWQPKSRDWGYPMPPADAG